MMKSAIKIAMETTTTVRVVLSPTPSVPPVVRRPKWQPTMAMMKPKTGVFDDAAQEVGDGHRLDRAADEEPRRDVELEVADEDGTERPEHEREQPEDGHRDDGGDHARDDELLRGVRPERADGVDLLGDVHRADLGRHAAADAPAHDHGGEGGGELARERKDDRRAGCTRGLRTARGRRRTGWS